MTQLRTTETKNDIKIAVTKLLTESDFESMSVTKICREAGINRGTFYHHYIDKFDMMDKLKTSSMEAINNIIKDETMLISYETILQALLYIHNDFEFFKVISQTSYARMSDSIREFLYAILNHIPDCNKWLENKFQVPQKYAKVAYVASIEALITDWIQKENPETPEIMATIITAVAN